MSEKRNIPNELLQKYLKIYLEENNSRDELEIRFGTKFWNPITRISFDNVLQKLKSNSWVIQKEDCHLNIQNEYIKEDGQVSMSNIRTTIHGISDIQKYCKTDRLDNIQNIDFMQKFKKRAQETSNFKGQLEAIDFDDFHFRINYKTERKLKPNDKKVKTLLDSWTDTKKTFRYIKRVTLTHSEFPFQIDCSIVKTSNKTNKRYLVSEYKIEQSNVFNNEQTYEIEIELINYQMKRKSRKWFIQGELSKAVKNGIKLVLSGIQKTNFPISFVERDLILKQYYSLIYFGENPPETKKISSRQFIGPSSISLEMQNIIKLNDISSEPNINNPYTVTDKADGERKLLYINKTGKVYLIDVNMNVQFTGCIVKHKSYLNTIIDGEHVISDINGNYINKYLAFDIYISNRKDMRAYPFIPGKDLIYEDKDLEKDIFRKINLEEYIQKFKPESIIPNKEIPMTFGVKKFYNNIEETIFIQCKKVMNDVDNSLYEYETDGLIFTPAFFGVGSDKIGKAGPKTKTTWLHSFKWKPPEYNTIDFLITTEKNPETKTDIIKNILNEGVDMSDSSQFKSYKTVELRVGFDETLHGFLEPLEDMINDNLPKKRWSNYDEDRYKPRLFKPTNPTPEYPIYNCNIMLNNQSGIDYMMIEDKKDSFEDWNIVEFKFEKDNDPGWQWIPIRVRYDKTAELHSGKRKNYGNAYHVAQSVWRSINNPITKHMITTGLNIQEELVDDTVYYKKKSKETTTRYLRDFHNKFVKRELISKICKKGDTLIDHSVGKAGDLQKWINAELSFVFGIDYSKDNIINKLDGACSRYLEACKKNKILPDALFIHGNSSLPILNGNATAETNTLATTTINAVFGTIEKDKNLPKGILKNYGKGKNGFDVVSNQFSIHYFFKNITTFHNFLRNVCETCKVGGYFIGTCYDGYRVFDKLSKKKYEESVFINNGEDKMWEIKKLYNKTEFPNTDESLGYEIDVYQESINKFIPEYLVNFNYLISSLQLYGFEPVDDENARKLGFPMAIASFKDLFDLMDDQINNKKLKKNVIGNALRLSSNEKKISFLNNYFIFQKKSNPDAVAISRMMINKNKHLDDIGDDAQPEKITIKRKVRKLKKTINLPLG